MTIFTEEGWERSPRYLAFSAFHVLALAGVCAALYWIGRDNLLSYIDGHYLRVLSETRAELTAPAFGVSKNFLQGLGEIYYFVNTDWSAIFGVARLFSDPAVEMVAIHTLATIQIFLLGALILFWFKVRPGPAMAASWMTVALVAPFTFPALIYNVTPDGPLVKVVFIPFLIVILFAALGKGGYRRDLLIAAGIVLLAWLHIVSVGLFTLLTYPFIGVFGAVFLLAARDKREFFVKLLIGLGVVGALVASRYAQLLAGLALDNAFQFFPDDLTLPNPTLADGSILFRWSAAEPAGVVAAALGLAGAAFFAVAGRGPVRPAAIATLILFLIIAGLSVLWSETNWSGARPIYYEYPLWFIYPIFATLLIAQLLSWLLRLAVRPYGSIRRGGAVAVAVAPVVVTLAVHGGNHLYRGAENQRPNVYPPSATPITELLKNEVAMAANAPFRGRVATMTVQELEAARWDEEFTLDVELIRRLGNEHRNIGLWRHRIPTLFAFSHTIGPALFAVVDRYLDCPGDTQPRNVLNIRCANASLLALLGVKYVIHDSPNPLLETSTVMAIDAGDRRLAVDWVERVNLGYSPTEILPVPSDRRGLDWLGRPGVDFTRQAIIDRPDPGPLTAAANVVILVTESGLTVKATSPGRSLIVLPFEYSQCWRVKPNGGSAEPTLVRANFLLTGVLFEGDLDVDLDFEAGPFTGQCLLADYFLHRYMFSG